MEKMISYYLLQGRVGHICIFKKPEEFHCGGVALGQAGEAVLLACQQLPQLVRDCHR